jgi:hypothetical protein
MIPWRSRVATVLASLTLGTLVVIPALRVPVARAAAGAAAGSRPGAPVNGPVGRAHTAVPVQATPGPGQIVVRGRVFYTDRLGDRNHPAGGLRVEIWDRDEGFGSAGEKLGEAVTDEAGRFESPPIANVDPDGPTGEREGTQDVFLKLLTDNGRVTLNDATTRRAFDWTSYEIDARDGAPMRNVPDGIVSFPTLFIKEATPDAEAMWTFVNLSETWQYLKAHAGGDPGHVAAFWSRGSLNGPRYDPAAREVYFRDEDADFEDVVIQYGAYALIHNIYGDLPASWRACLDRVPDDPRTPASAECALFHGVATFVALAVSSDAEYETPLLSAIDMDAATGGTAHWADGDTVPGRVAAAFWDLHEGDATVEQYDRFNATFADIWTVFAARRPETMRAWWDGWRDLGRNGCGAVGSLYQNTIDYNTPPRIQPVPDVVIEEDETAIVDLKNYVDDAECSRDLMAFTLEDPGAPEAGVKLLATSVISITPQADWFGQTSVVVGVSDGLVSSTLTFDILVRSRNDCPRISPRVPEPPPTLHVDPIVVELEQYGKDAEDPPQKLVWDAELDEANEPDITVLGRGTRTLVFVLERAITTHYGAVVTLVLRDTDGCSARQSLALYWTAEGNQAPRIRADRFTRAYHAPVNTTIRVDLTGVAEDDEDADAALEWFVLDPGDLHAQVRKVERQIIDFEPAVGFIGSDVAQLEVQDTGAARVTAAITLTWTTREQTGNQAPQILRSRLLGQTAGLNSEVCYDLTDKAVDPDNNLLSLRWYADPEDPRDLFVGAQGTRRLCLKSRQDFEGCLVATFIVRDPRDAEDRHDVRTCWRRIALYMPSVGAVRR